MKNDYSVYLNNPNFSSQKFMIRYFFPNVQVQYGYLILLSSSWKSLDFGQYDGEVEIKMPIFL